MYFVRGPIDRFVVLRFFRVCRGARQNLRARIGGHPAAKRAQQFVDRHAGGLARDVPQRDVNRAHRADGRGARALPQCLVKPLALERVMSHDCGLEVTDEPWCVDIGRLAGAAEKCIARNTFVGDDGEQAKLARAAELLVRRVIGFRNVVPGKQGQADVGDLHEVSVELALQCPVECVSRPAVRPS